jgi:site-specific DNA recombinase
MLKDRLHTLKAERNRAREALARAREHLSPHVKIDPDMIERFARAMRENFSTGSVPFRKAYLRALIDVIEVDDHQIRIKGSKSVLEKAVIANQNTGSECSQMRTPM